MVLQSKWDARATRARARKFKAKGKDLPEVAAQKAKEKALAQAAAASSKRNPHDPHDPSKPSSAVPSPSSDEDDLNLSSGDGDESEPDGIYLGSAASQAADAKVKEEKERKKLDPTPAEAAKAGEKGEDVEEEEDNIRSQFSRRKLVSNAFRYEDPPPPPPGSEELGEPEEPEPDYVALTTSRPSALQAAAEKDAKEKRETFDYAFLKEMKEAGKGKGKKKNMSVLEGFGMDDDEKKKNVVRVDKSEFRELEEKIKKRENVEAFRKRFAKRDVGSKTRRLRVEEEEEGDEDLDAMLGGAGYAKAGGGARAAADLDLFLGELGVEDNDKPTKNSAAPSKPQFSALSSSRKPALITSDPDPDDSWLDAMLETR